MGSEFLGTGTRFETELPSLEKLSERERQVLGLAAAGLLDKQIGQELGVSLNTLRTYWTRIRAKIGEGPRTALAAVYITSELKEEKPILGPVEHEGWVVDCSTMMMIASDSINDIHGLERGIPHPTTAYTTLYHPEDEARARAAIRSVIEGEVESIQVIFRLARDTGIEVVSLLARGVKDESGKTIKVIGYRSRTEDCRPNANSLVRMATWSRSFSTGDVWMDDDFCDLFGLRKPPGSQPGDGMTVHVDPEGTVDILADRFHPDDRERALNFVPNAVKAGLDRTQIDARVKLDDGNYLWLRSKVHIVRGEDGVTVYGNIATFQ